MKQTTNLLFLIIFGFFVNYSSAQCDETQKVFNTLKDWHVEPRLNSENYYNDVIAMYVKKIPASSLIALESDRELLLKDKSLLAGDILNGTCNFTSKAEELYKNQIDRLIVALEQIKTKPFNFSLKETYAADELETYSKTKDGLSIKWRKNIKVLAFVNLIDSLGLDYDYKSNEKALINSLKAESQRTLEFYIKSVKELQNDQNEISNRVKQALFSAMAEVFDPHSNYFTNNTKETFEAFLKTDFEIFGFSTEIIEGAYFISELYPGGNAWKTNRLHVGDQIIYIKVGHKKFKSDQLTREQFSALLSDEETRIVTLGIKDKGGKKSSVTLYKEVTKNETNVVQTFIVSKDEKRLGYISLPSFYTDFNGDRSKGCANDVAKAILTLTKDQVDGIILDLRFNGGGSVLEFINLAGIFINYGPLGIVDQGDKLKIIKDMNKGTITNLPLVVMVNGLSASASEMFAASIQNHQRGIIVGEPTYGKATMQNIIPVGLEKQEDKTAEIALDKMTGNSFLKVTLGKIYKADKISYQKKGVIPDVTLPSSYDNHIYGESRLPHALKSSTVEKELYFELPTPKQHTAIQELSKNRVAISPLFQRRAENMKKIDSLQKAAVPLSLFAYVKHEKMLKASIDEESELPEANQLNIENTTFESEIISLDPKSKELNEEVISYLKNDLELLETYRIAVDYINNLK